MSQAELEGQTLPRPRRRKDQEGWWQKHGISLVAVLVFLGLWQLSGLFLNPILLSTPVAVIRDWFQIALNGYLFIGLLEGFREMLIGLFFGVVVGITVGILMGRYQALDRILSPYVNFFNATPLIVIIPLVIIWIGITVNARIFLVFMITLWPMLLNTVSGIKNVPKGYMEVGQAFGFSERELIRKVAIPAAVPYILAGARVAAGLSIIGMIVGEMEISFFGLGMMLSTYGASFQTGHFFAVVLTSSIFGIVNVSILKWIQRRWFPWIAGTAGQNT
ncbi:MAG: ABC transporter permease [Firmicutes bacterium]|nr:ABC transporter permease [Bacillota bacterium]